MGIPYRNLGASDPSTTAQHAATVQDNIYCERGCHFKEASVMADLEQAWCDTHRRYCRISTEKADCSVVGLACTPYTHQRANHHDVSPEEHADFAMMFQPYFIGPGPRVADFDAEVMVRLLSEGAD